MAQGQASFTVLAADTVGTVYTVAHGLSSTPQIVFAWANGHDALGVVQRNAQKSFGIGVLPKGATTVKMICTGAHTDNNVSLTQADVTFRRDCIACELPIGVGATVTAGLLELTSLDATNIKFTLDEQFTSNSLIKIWFIAGNDLTWIDLNIYRAPLASGVTAYTSLAFKPDLLIGFSDHLSQDTPFIQPDSGTFFAACDSALNQFTWMGGVNTQGGGGAGSSGRAATYSLAGKFVAVVNSTTQSINCQGSVQSLDANGFTINYDTVNLEAGQTQGRTFAVLAIQGAQWRVGNFNTFTDTSSHNVVTGLPFNPEGVLFSSAAKPASTNLTLDPASEAWSVGLLDSTHTLVTAMGQRGLTWGPNTVAWTDQATTLVYTNVDTSPTRVGTASAALISGGFSWQHGIADPTQNFVGYIAYATQPKAGVLTTVVKTVKPHGGGDYTSLASALAGELATHKNMDIQNIILEFDCYAGLDTSPVTVTGQNNTNGVGYMTTSTNYLFIKAIDGHAGRIISDGSKYLLDINGNGSVFGMLIRNEFVRFRQLQLRLTITDGSQSGGGFFCATTQMVAPTHWEFINCIEQHVLSNGSIAECFHPPSAAFDVAGIVAIYVNCVAYDVISRDITTTGFQATLSVNQSIVRYNCTAINCNQGFQDRQTVVDKNNVAIGCDNGWNTAAGPNAASDNNFSTNGPTGILGQAYPGLTVTAVLDAKGNHSVNGLPVAMVDPLNGDYRPLAGVDTSLIGQGLDLSADATYPFNFDVANTSRVAPWTKGAWHVTLAAQAQAYLWALVGGVTSTRAVIKCKYNLPETINLQLDTTPNFGAPLSFGAAGDVRGVATFVLTGLTANTKYYYRTNPISAPTTFSATGSFTAFPTEGHQASFTVVLGGCSDTGSNTNLYDAYRSYNPLLYIVYGDLHYWNISSCERSLHHTALDTTFLPKRTRLLLQAPLDYVWDDHDFGPDQADNTDPAHDVAELFYRSDVPAYTLPGDTVATDINVARDATGTQTVLTGTRTTPTDYITTNLEHVDMTALRIKCLNTDVQPLRIEGATGYAFIGGEVIGQNPPDTSWATMHDFYGILVKDAVRPRFQNCFVFNYGDGVSFDSTVDSNWELHGVYVKYSRDDGIEDDFYNVGSINDCLIDGCYDFMSCNKYASPPDGSRNLIVINDTLVRLQAMDGVFAGTTPNHEAFWKWDASPAPDLTAPMIILNNVVFRTDSDTWDHGGGTMFMAPPPSKLIYAKNCTMCWLGSGSFPETLPAGFTLLTGAAALAYWNTAVAAWKARHPFLLADVTAPICSMFSPTSGTIGGNVDLWATAVDDRDVAGVQFKVDGVAIGTEQLAVTAYQPAEARCWDLTTKYHILWDSHAVSNGVHTLSVTARDTSGNSRTSATVSVTVSN